MFFVETEERIKLGFNRFIFSLNLLKNKTFYHLCSFVCLLCIFQTCREGWFDEGAARAV